MPKNNLGLLIWWLLPTLIVLLLAAPHITGPFSGDQALYAYSGQAILDGELLYRDFVDIKHPGVHYYYAISLALFSSFFSPEVSVHLLELMLWVCVGLLVQHTLKSRLSHPFIAALAPIALGGAYYITVDPADLSQVEALPGPIICLGIWLASCNSNPTNKNHLRSFLAGAVLSSVLIFHGHMIAVAIALLLIAGVSQKNLLPLLAGFLTVVVAICLYFIFTGGWSGLWHVYISYPFTAGIEVPEEPGGFARIQWSMTRFIVDFAPWIVLAGIAVLHFPRLMKDTFATQHLAWGLIALATMMLESRNSWTFHFLYYLVPVGVVAVYGLDSLATVFGRYGKTIAAIAGIGALLPGLLMNWKDIREHQNDVSAVNARIYADTDFLRQKNALPGPIYVFGSQVYHKQSGRKQALPRNGWGWEVALNEHWNRLPDQLAAAKPAYVYVSAHYYPMLQKKALDVLQLLESDYEERSADAYGRWFALR